MAYKNIDALLNELGHLSKPGLGNSLNVFFNELEAYISGYARSFPDSSLSGVITGYQHGYSARSVAEFLVDTKVKDIFNTAMNGHDSASTAVYADLNKTVTIITTENNPFFRACDYRPDGHEAVMDPLDVIMDINTRRVNRQKDINLDGGKVEYPGFGTWVDKAIRIGSAAEANAIKDFRSEVQKEIQAIERIWFV